MGMPLAVKRLEISRVPTGVSNITQQQKVVAMLPIKSL